jgi:hypothetical protein
MLTGRVLNESVYGGSVAITVQFRDGRATLNGEEWTSSNQALADHLNIALFEQRDEWLTGRYHPDRERFIADRTIEMFEDGSIIGISEGPATPEGAVY